MILFSEAIKLKDGKLYNLPYHQQRVDRTVSDFYGTRLDISPLQEMVPAFARQGLFKCRLVYGPRIETVGFTPYALRTLKKVGVIADDALDYSYKYADRSALDALLRKSGCDEIVILREGRATDASAFNLVFGSGEGFFTPEDYLLPGTKRQSLLDEGAVAERRIRTCDFGEYDTLHFINAMTDLADGVQVRISELVWL